MKLSNRLELLVQRLNTQDNRATAHPIFIVQQEHRIYGMDPKLADSTTKCVWQFKWNSEDLYETLEDAMDCEGQDDEDDFEKIYYVIEWRYVCAHFTEAAAQEYIRTNIHNLDNPRIYVDSQYRCDEWNDTIEILKRLGRAVCSGDDAIDDALTRKYAPVVVPDQD